MATTIPSTIISKHMKDLLTRSPEVVEKCLYDPNKKRDYDRGTVSKGLAARAFAARYIIEALSGSARHGDTVLERVEGKVASGETQAGTLIQFCFSLAPGQPSQLPEARTSRLINPSAPARTEPVPSATRSDEYSEPDGSD